jgi:hypothetical protein
MKGITYLPPEQLVENILQQDAAHYRDYGAHQSPSGQTVMNETTGNIVLYKVPDGSISLDIKLRDETAWLNLN